MYTENVPNVRRRIRQWLGSRTDYEEVPYSFIKKVQIALEYAMTHQDLDEEERTRRRTRTNEWLDEMRAPGAYTSWLRAREAHYAEMLRPQTPEEVATQAHREALRKQAEARAERLLQFVLSAKQKIELDRKAYFHVEVGERRFRLTRGRTNNIIEVDKRSRTLRTFCVHPVENVPIADILVAQKLYLEGSPEALFQLANVRRPHRARSNALERAHQQARREIARLARAGVVRTQEDRQAALAEIASHNAEEGHFIDAALDATATLQAPLDLDPRDLRPIRAAFEILNPPPADGRAA